MQKDRVRSEAIENPSAPATAAGQRNTTDFDDARHGPLVSSSSKARELTPAVGKGQTKASCCAGAAQSIAANVDQALESSSGESDESWWQEDSATAAAAILVGSVAGMAIARRFRERARQAQAEVTATHLYFAELGESLATV